MTRGKEEGGSINRLGMGFGTVTSNAPASSGRPAGGCVVSSACGRNDRFTAPSAKSLEGDPYNPHTCYDQQRARIHPEGDSMTAAHAEQSAQDTFYSNGS